MSNTRDETKVVGDAGFKATHVVRVRAPEPRFFTAYLPEQGSSS